MLTLRRNFREVYFLLLQVMNVQIANDMRELNRQDAENKSKMARTEFLEDEARKAEARLDDINSKWDVIARYNDAIDIHNACEIQKSDFQLFIFSSFIRKVAMLKFSSQNLLNLGCFLKIYITTHFSVYQKHYNMSSCTQHISLTQRFHFILFQINTRRYSNVKIKLSKR